MNDRGRMGRVKEGIILVFEVLLPLKQTNQPINQLSNEIEVVDTDRVP